MAQAARPARMIVAKRAAALQERATSAQRPLLIDGAGVPVTERKRRS
jgi:hypothetical protein